MENDSNKVIIMLLESLNKTVNSTADDVRSLTLRMDRLEEKVDRLAEDVAVLKEDVAVLKADVAAMKEDIAILKEDSEITRHAVNRLGEWAENVETVVGIPYARIAN